MYVCVKCGRVNGFDMVNECVDFNEINIKFAEKVCITENIISRIFLIHYIKKKFIGISYNKRKKIYDIFNKID